MLGKAAYVATQQHASDPVIDTQSKAEERSHGMKKQLWEIMVRSFLLGPMPSNSS